MKKRYILFFLLMFSSKALPIGPILQAYCTHMWLGRPQSRLNESQQRLFALGSLFNHIRSVDFYGLYCAEAVTRDDVSECTDPFQAGIKFSCYIQKLCLQTRYSLKIIPHTILRRRLFLETVEDEILYNTLTTETNDFDEKVIRWLQQSPDEREFIFGETPATIQAKHHSLIARLITQPSVLMTIAYNTHSSYAGVSDDQLNQWRMLLPDYVLNHDLLLTLSRSIRTIRQEMLS